VDRDGLYLFVASVVGVETVIPAAVQTEHDYTWRDVRFGERFVEIYTEQEPGRITVDYGRLHDTESVKQDIALRRPRRWQTSTALHRRH
jgi:hypothetical protein